MLAVSRSLIRQSSCTNSECSMFVIVYGSSRNPRAPPVV